MTIATSSAVYVYTAQPGGQVVTVTRYALKGSRLAHASTSMTTADARRHYKKMQALAV